MFAGFSVAGGQKARVVFAELACRQPDVLILVRAAQPADVSAARLSVTNSIHLLFSSG